MNTLRLKNYRCFEDTGDISIKPITLLLGANSSGKSSFLKFFPLLKQSIGIRKNGVFLWYSDDVDFKDFKNTVRNGKGSITINMELPLVDTFRYNDSNLVTVFYKKKGLKENSANTKIELTISAKDKNTDFLERLSISYYDQRIDISFSKNGDALIIVNEDDTIIDTKCSGFYYVGDFLPQISFAANDSNYLGSKLVREKIINYLESCKIKDIQSNELFSRTFYFLGKDLLKELLSFILSEGGKKLSLDLDKLNNLYLLYKLNSILEYANICIHNLAFSISYVKPLRVMPERYYRYQNYSVDEISSDGKNLAMYFANLKNDELKRFQRWTNRLFGFMLVPLKLEGHVEIDIIEDKTKKTGRNMVDTGFGYNQLLPILAIIWKAINNKLRSYYSSLNSDIRFIVIEQPELHLHPRILSMFAEMLASVINDFGGNKDVRFIIETHSETIINKIGSLINSSKLDESKVNVVLFNAQNEGLNNYVEQASFDSDGYLSNWPTGFFL